MAETEVTTTSNMAAAQEAYDLIKQAEAVVTMLKEFTRGDDDAVVIHSAAEALENLLDQALHAQSAVVAAVAHEETCHG